MYRRSGYTCGFLVLLEKNNTLHNIYIWMIKTALQFGLVNKQTTDIMVCELLITIPEDGNLLHRPGTIQRLKGIFHSTNFRTIFHTTSTSYYELITHTYTGKLVARRYLILDC